MEQKIRKVFRRNNKWVITDSGRRAIKAVVSEIDLYKYKSMLVENASDQEQQ